MKTEIMDVYISPGDLKRARKNKDSRAVVFFSNEEGMGPLIKASLEVAIKEPEIMITPNILKLALGSNGFNIKSSAIEHAMQSIFGEDYEN